MASKTKSKSKSDQGKKAVSKRRLPPAKNTSPSRKPKSAVKNAGKKSTAKSSKSASGKSRSSKRRESPSAKEKMKSGFANALSKTKKASPQASKTSKHLAKVPPKSKAAAGSRRLSVANEASRGGAPPKAKGAGKKLKKGPAVSAGKSEKLVRSTKIAIPKSTPKHLQSSVPAATPVLHSALAGDPLLRRKKKTLPDAPARITKAEREELKRKKAEEKLRARESLAKERAEALAKKHAEKERQAREREAARGREALRKEEERGLRAIEREAERKRADEARLREKEALMEKRVLDKQRAEEERVAAKAAEVARREKERSLALVQKALRDAEIEADRRARFAEKVAEKERKLLLEAEEKENARLEKEREKLARAEAKEAEREAKRIEAERKATEKSSSKEIEKLLDGQIRGETKALGAPLATIVRAYFEAISKRPSIIVEGGLSEPWTLPDLLANSGSASLEVLAFLKGVGPCDLRFRFESEALPVEGEFGFTSAAALEERLGENESLEGLLRRSARRAFTKGSERQLEVLDSISAPRFAWKSELVSLLGARGIDEKLAISLVEFLGETSRFLFDEAETEEGKRRILMREEFNEAPVGVPLHRYVFARNAGRPIEKEVWISLLAAHEVFLENGGGDAPFTLAFEEGLPRATYGIKDNAGQLATPLENLTGLKCSGVRLSYANLAGVRAKNGNFARSELLGAMLSCSHLPEANFSGANLRGADLSRSLLKGADFRKADLTDVNFEGADLEGAQFAGAITSGTSFSDANVRGIKY